MRNTRNFEYGNNLLKWIKTENSSTIFGVADEKIILAKNIFIALDYFDVNIDNMQQLLDNSSKDDKGKNVLRCPSTNLSIHVDYGNTEKTKQQILSTIIECNLASQTILESDDDKKFSLMKGFLERIKDSVVGCIEERIGNALKFVQTGTVDFMNHFSDNMKRFWENDAFLVNRLIEHFYEKIQADIKVEMIINNQEYKGPLTWKLLKDYIICSEEDEKFECNWKHYYKNLPSLKDKYSGTDESGRTKFYWYNFETHLEAICYLGYIKSCVEDDWLKHANVNENRYINPKSPYGFKLSEKQKLLFENYISDMEAQFESDMWLSESTSISSNSKDITEIQHTILELQNYKSILKNELNGPCFNRDTKERKKAIVSTLIQQLEAANKTSKVASKEEVTLVLSEQEEQLVRKTGTFSDPRLTVILKPYKITVSSDESIPFSNNEEDIISMDNDHLDNESDQKCSMM